jgi:hypothetical protein
LRLGLFSQRNEQISVHEGVNMLRVGESSVVPVDSKKYWNDSGIILERDGRYQFASDPAQQWLDWSNPANANGYKSNSLLLKLSEWFRRVPSADWFTLIGAIGMSERAAFIIGCSLKDFQPVENGRLYCFANDLSFMYWNNSGTVTVRVTRAG